MKNSISAILFSAAIVIAAFLLGNAYMDRTKAVGNISVTGLGKTDFTSDLIVWEGTFSKDNYNLKEAYANLARDKKVIEKYILAKGIKKENIIFNSVNSSKNTRNLYSADGKYQGQEFVGYHLTQTVQIDSKDVSKVESISREITELLNQGVELYSQPPRYYYTKLEDLKIELVSAATENARLRAEKIAANSGSKLGDLKEANMGIIQITGQNSNEDYSWGGAFNTSSKEKTASITMKLDYEVE